MSFGGLELLGFMSVGRLGFRVYGFAGFWG